MQYNFVIPHKNSFLRFLGGLGDVVENVNLTVRKQHDAALRCTFDERE